MNYAVRYLPGVYVCTGFAERLQKPVLKIWRAGRHFVDRDPIRTDNDNVGKGADDVDPS